MFAFLVIVPMVASAQDQNSPAAANQQLLKSEELDALVAPIALYPDTLLAEVLMASTYPIEVVQAEQWATENKNLKGDQLKAAVDKQAWDESVKSLVATESVLAMMSTKLDWTQKLGDTLLAQQPDVMDAIQRLRSKAQANNKLSSTKEQKVSVKQEQDKQVIVIEPTVPDTIYVPYYDPVVVYGGWLYPAYPPYYFPPPVYISHPIIAAGIAFGAGYVLGRWASGGNYWGGGVNWGGNNININRPININNIGNNWQHRPEHRQGVRYNNASVQQKFGNNNIRSGSQQRMDYRGRGGEQAARPSGGSANLGDHGGAGRPSAGASRPGTGDQAKGAPSAAARPSSGTRAQGRGDALSSISNPSGLGRGDAFSSISNPSGLGRGDAFSNIQSGSAARLQSQRGQASLGGSGGFHGGGSLSGGGGGGGGARAGGGGGRGGGGGGGRGGGGGGRRSDIRLKHDITLIGRLDNGLGYYRFVYNGDDKAYVGVMAQEVQSVMPDAVALGQDGYLRVFYDQLGLKFETYDQWIASGAQIPSAARVLH